MAAYNAIIIGAGHNGLVCAAYLASQGQSVLVLEASETVGGLAAVREFHPGFKASVAHTINQFSSRIARDLNLESHGFDPGQALTTVGLSLSGEHVVLNGESVTGVGSEDEKAYGDYLGLLGKFARALKPFWLKTMPGIGDNSLGELFTFAQIGLKLRMLGQADMREFLRVARTAHARPDG